MHFDLRSLLRFAFPSAACVLAGCGPTNSSDLGTNGSELKGALAGHWDVVGSDADGLTRTGTLDLTKTSLRVSFGDYVLRFNDDGAGATTLWEDHSQKQMVLTTIPTVHAAEGLNAGIIPLSLGGDWVLRDAQRPGAQCAAYLTGDSFASQCADVKVQPSVADFYASHPFPWWASYGWGEEEREWYAAWRRFESHEQVPSPNGDFAGVRLRKLASSFGDLGGEWELTGSGGVVCHATLDGATFTSSCDGIQGYESQSDANGSITIQFGDGIASGSTSKGIELSARRVHT